MNTFIDQIIIEIMMISIKYQTIHRSTQTIYVSLFSFTFIPLFIIIVVVHLYIFLQLEHIDANHQLCNQASFCSFS